MMPKARGLVQHGGPPGCLEESDPAGMILYVMDGHAPALTYCTTACIVVAQLWAPGKPSCCSRWPITTVSVHKPPTWGMSHKEGMAWYSRPMSSLWLPRKSWLAAPPSIGGTVENMAKAIDILSLFIAHCVCQLMEAVGRWVWRGRSVNVYVVGVHHR
jgi:hypothetical protein